MTCRVSAVAGRCRETQSASASASSRSQRARRRARGSARRTRTGRRPPPACRRPARARATSWPMRPKPEHRRASCRRARRRRSSSAPSGRRRARGAPRGCGGPAPASAPPRARPPRACWTAGALQTTMPRAVAAGTSTLSTPVPARPTTRRRRAGGQQLGVDLGGRPHHQRVVVADRARAASARSSSELDVDLGDLPQPADARLGDLLGDEHAIGHHATGTTASTARAKAPTPEPSSTTCRGAAAPAPARGCRRRGRAARCSRTRRSG